MSDKLAFPSILELSPSPRCVSDEYPPVDQLKLKLQAETIKYAPLRAFSQGLSSPCISDDECRLMHALLHDGSECGLRTTNVSKSISGELAFMVRC